MPTHIPVFGAAAREHSIQMCSPNNDEEARGKSSLGPTTVKRPTWVKYSKFQILNCLKLFSQYISQL